MEITSLGNTNLKVTKMGLGLAALGRPGYINIGHDHSLGEDKSVSAMENNAHRVLDFAWGNGLRFFDTARSYGHAELFLASWLTSRNIDPDGVTISSKWGYVYTADWKVKAEKHEVKHHTLQNFKKQWAESQEILGSYIHLYQIHSATLDSGVLENTEILTALAELKSKGISIGLSLSGTKQTDTLRKAVECEIDGSRLFDTVQLTWNILENSTTDILREAHNEGLGVIVKEALANGRLFHFKDEAEAVKSVMNEIIVKQNASPDAIALSYINRQPYVDTLLSGATTVEQLNSNLKFTDVELSQNDIENLNKVKESPGIYWQKRSDMNWN